MNVMKNKITGEMYVHAGKQAVFIDGVRFEQVTKRRTDGIRDTAFNPVLKIRSDSLEKISK